MYWLRFAAQQIVVACLNYLAVGGKSFPPEGAVAGESMSASQKNVVQHLGELLLSHVKAPPASADDLGTSLSSLQGVICELDKGAYFRLSPSG
eukprot:5143084-Amphidinium_carterae.1